MGFTPLEGLVMGTRSGDLDPSLPLFIAEKERLSPEAVESLLNRESGLLALSGVSADMRQIEAAAEAGNRDAAFALELFCYRITKYVGAFAAAMSGIDAVLFGGGIGEHSASVRGRVCENLAWLGLQFDPTANANPSGLARISLATSSVEAWVVPVDEDDVIARDVFATLNPSAP
jgi:acetate kinase